MVEIIEAADMNPSDLNGLADPYVKGRLGPYRFRTRTQKKTLAPKWQEEFKIPIVTWESQNILLIEVRDKDHIFDDMMGDCSVNINELRDGQRRDMWLSLNNIKMGRLHLAVTVSEGNGKGAELSCDAEGPDGDDRRMSFAADSIKKASFSSRSSEKSPKVADEFEPIDIEGYPETGIWIHHPGSEVAQVWEPRKGKIRHLDSRRVDAQIRDDGGEYILSSKSIGPNSGQNDGSSTDESVDTNKSQSKNPVRKGLRKLGSVFRRSPRPEDKSTSLEELEPSPRYNVRELNNKEVGVTFVVDETIAPPSVKTPKEGVRFVADETLVPPSVKIPKDDEDLPADGGPESPQQGPMKDMAKSILKHAGKSARGLKSAFSRKASRKCRAEPGMSPTDKDVVLDSNLSDDESRCSSSADVLVAETALVVPGSAVSHPASDVLVAETALVVPGSAVSHPASFSSNDTLKLKDPVIPKTILSNTKSLKRTDNTIQIDGSSLEQAVKIHPEST